MLRTSLIGVTLLAAFACKKASIEDRGSLDASFDPMPALADAARADDGALIQPDAHVSNTDCDEARQHSDFAWLQAKVFTPSCATSACHDAVDPDVHLDLSAGAAYPNLVNKGASTQTGWIRVVPGSLEESYLVVALGRAPGPMPRDGFMPLDMPPLCDEKLDAIERWILAGAPND